MSDDLERELADERARRAALERRLAGEVEKTRLWRERAEERAERISRLEEEGLAARAVRAVRKLRRPAPPEATATSPAPRRPVLPVVRVASAVASGAIRPALETMDHTSLDDPGRDPAEVDVVVVEPATLARLPADSRARVRTFAESSGRPPLVVWADDADPAPPEWLLTAAEAVAVTRPEHSSAWPDQHRVRLLPASFDVDVHNPSRPPAGPPIPIPDLDAPPGRGTLEAAAGHAVEGDDAQRLAVRRWAFRRHAPWVRAAELLQVAGVDAPDPTPRVAGLLVSRRPDRIAAAVEGFARQTYPATELVVGLHGIDVDLGRVVDAVPAAIQVLHLPAELPLGACLNAAAEATTAPVLAKIDDDDHYGPGHLEDAVHALRYTPAGVVGKAAMYVYLAGQDRTLLRRSGDEERYVTGTMPGGTLVMWRRVWEAVRFPHRPRFVDVWLLEGARLAGERTYANTRFEFCLMRDDDHTYRAEEDTFLAGATEAWPGFHPDRLEASVGPTGPR